MSKEKEADIPDSIKPYLNEIAERLWAGRAAVMVGAGFSKNAGQGFPDWNQLGDLFYLKAHGIKSDPNQQKYLNVLRLAEEVQAAIGRPALENLLRSNIPDLTIEPSDLHVELLDLPWADVFTTNYDTLLERASAKVVTRRYEPVVNKEDIPYAIKPRIVKLHGSFPSERPFIITEEDYRRYPHDNAPFVNTVQQAFLENTFCLIGFSGDDPNFLQWTGWIRDNLGRDKSQKIYLVGVFDLSSARLQLLAQRGITVVDFSYCQRIGKRDHKKALKAFLDYMQSKNPNSLDWPYGPQTMRPNRGADRIEEIKKITEEWRTKRESYPGWLILPYDNRNSLWIFTQGWVDYLPDTEKSPVGFDIQYAYELIWRFDRCLMPFLSRIAVFSEKVLERYWPFKTEAPPANCQFRAAGDGLVDLPWDDLKQAWLAIALTMLRYYRENGLIEKWKKAENQLKSLSDHLSAEQREFLKYEGFLFCLFTFDLSNAKQRLESWRLNESQPYWMAKRAVAFAEIGPLNELDDHVRLSLAETRKKNIGRSNQSSCLSVSHEAYQMLLLRYIKDSSGPTDDKDATIVEKELMKKRFEKKFHQRVNEQASDRDTKSITKPLGEFKSFEDDWNDLMNKNPDRKFEKKQLLNDIRNDQRERERQQQNARWDEIKAFRCDPWNELRLFELILGKQPVQRNRITEKREFDIAQGNLLLFYNSDQEALNAYSFLRFCEEIGLPFRVGNFIATKGAEATLKRISQYSFFWATATLARIGDSKAVDHLFNMESVYRITSKEADLMIQTYLDALDKSKDDINAGDAFRNDNYGIRLAQLLPEVISRLCCKCSTETRHSVLVFIRYLYGSSAKSKFRGVGNLAKRLISSMSEQEQYELIPEFLKIPFPENLNTIAKRDFPNPLGLLELNQKPECSIPALEVQPELISCLLNQAALDEKDKRNWAIISLEALHYLKLLDADQSKKFAEAIWSIVDDEYGLPDSTNFYKFFFLRLPHPETINPPHLFKEYVKATPFPIQKNNQGTGFTITGGDILIIDEILGAVSTRESFWTPDDAVEILQRLIEWWDADKDILREKENGSMSKPAEFRNRFSRIVDVISEVIGPNISEDSHADIKSSLGRTLKEMGEYGLSVLVAEAACLHIHLELKNDVYGRINESLISSQNEARKDGLRAIEKIILSGFDVETNSVEPDPVSMLCQYLAWSPTKSITQSLLVLVRIFKKNPVFFTKRLEETTLKRLDKLIAETDYDKGNEDLSIDEKLEVRQASASLAAVLFSLYKSRNSSAPNAVEKWRYICLSSDEFSEIRNAWINFGGRMIQK